MRQLKIIAKTTNRTNVIEKYFADIQRCSTPITTEEEVRLAKLIRQGDEKALKALVSGNLRFVVSVAKQYQFGTTSLADLINYGNEGLIKAALKFDETRGFKFISYAVWWVRQSIMQGLSDEGKLVRLPLNKVQQIGKIKKSIAILEQQLEREPTDQEVMEATNLSPDIFGFLKQGMLEPSSLDMKLDEDESVSLYDILQNDNAPTDQHLYRESMINDLNRVLNTLPEKNQLILRDYFGFTPTGEAKEPLTLEEIGLKLSLTRERVRQIKEKTLIQLREKKNIKLLFQYIN